MDEKSLEQTMALMARTPAALDALLRELPSAWTRCNEGENTWSAFDVVGHLIHTERNVWMVRAKTVLEFGEVRVFDPVDRFVQLAGNQGKTLGSLLDEFSRARSENLAELRSLGLQPADFAKLGKHPALGRVTLSQLVAAWAGHDLTHLHQIPRILAHQYREAVGPWHVYLGVLRCTGHSS